MKDEWPTDNEDLLRDGECPVSSCIEPAGHSGPHSGDMMPAMTTDRKPITDEDLAGIEGLCRLALAAGIDTVEQDAARLLALVAEVRELRAEVKHIDEANTALGSQVIDLMRERDEAQEALDAVLVAVGNAQKLDTDARDINIEALCGAARIWKEVKGEPSEPLT